MRHLENAIDWGRSALGFTPSGPSAATADASPQSAANSTAAAAAAATEGRVRKMGLELRAVRDEIADLTAQAEASAARGDEQQVAHLVVCIERAEQEAATLQGQIENQRHALRLQAQAETNLGQAESMRDGAQQLSATVRRTNAIDVEQVADTYRTAAEDVHATSAIFADPNLFAVGDPDAVAGGGRSMVIGARAQPATLAKNARVEAMMAKAQERKAVAATAALPAVPVAAVDAPQRKRVAVKRSNAK